MTKWTKTYNFSISRLLIVSQFQRFNQQTYQRINVVSTYLYFAYVSIECTELAKEFKRPRWPRALRQTSGRAGLADAAALADLLPSADRALTYGNN